MFSGHKNLGVSVQFHTIAALLDLIGNCIFPPVRYSYHIYLGNISQSDYLTPVSLVPEALIAQVFPSHGPIDENQVLSQSLIVT